MKQFRAIFLSLTSSIILSNCGGGDAGNSTSSWLFHEAVEACLSSDNAEQSTDIILSGIPFSCSKKEASDEFARLSPKTEEGRRHIPELETPPESAFVSPVYRRESSVHWTSTTPRADVIFGDPPLKTESVVSAIYSRYDEAGLQEAVDNWQTLISPCAKALVIAFEPYIGPSTESIQIPVVMSCEFSDEEIGRRYVFLVKAGSFARDLER